MRARAMLAAALLVGCTSPSGPPPVTRLEIYAVPTIVEQCDEALKEWTVNVRETGEHYSSACDQGIVVNELEPYDHYTLEISGYAPEGLCWFGKCSVTPLPGLDIADCAHVVTDLCTNDEKP